VQHERDHRIDLLRGFALVEIFVNHMPGNFYESFTHRNFGFSDSAELFVLLSGCAAAHAYYPQFKHGDWWAASAKAMRRAGTLYLTQIFITVSAIAILCMAALHLDQPDYLTDRLIFMNLRPMMSDPVTGFVGLATLGHQLGYFNILPMYIALLLMLPAMMLLCVWSRLGLLAASAGLWIIVGTLNINLPSYPLSGGWFFNPLAWQVVFVTGFVLAVVSRESRADRYSPLLFWSAVSVLLGGLICSRFGLWDWFKLSFLPARLGNLEKGFVSVQRLAHVIALLYVMVHSSFGRWLAAVSPQNPLTIIGRHGLIVFCAGSLLSLGCSIIRIELHGGFVLDSLLVLGGLGALLALAISLDRGQRVRVLRIA